MQVCAHTCYHALMINPGCVVRFEGGERSFCWSRCRPGTLDGNVIELKVGDLGFIISIDGLIVCVLVHGRLGFFWSDVAWPQCAVVSEA